VRPPEAGQSVEVPAAVAEDVAGDPAVEATH
jgi:hypothetical protein